MAYKRFLEIDGSPGLVSQLASERGRAGSAVFKGQVLMSASLRDRVEEIALDSPCGAQPPYVDNAAMKLVRAPKH